MINKYTLKAKWKRFKKELVSIYYAVLFLYVYFYCKLLGYDWKTGRYNKKHIIGRFLYKELRVGPNLIPKEEVTVHPLKDPSGMIEHVSYTYTKKDWK